MPTPEGLEENSQQQLMVIIIITSYQALIVCQALGTTLLNLSTARSLIKVLLKHYFWNASALLLRALISLSSELGCPRL